MPLTPAQRKQLKALAHHLKPVVQIGQKGITESLIKAIDQALFSHELIKVKFIDFKDEKDSLILDVTEQTGSDLVNRIGNIAILFRQNDDKEQRKIII